MTTTLRVVVDQMLARVPGGIGRYTEELTRELIRTAPRDCEVEAVFSAHPPEKEEELRLRLPGLARLHRLHLGRRELSRTWQYGIGIPSGGGMMHAPSLFAPLRNHEGREGEQIAVTIHDTVPWTHPETLTPHGAKWHRAMAKRAQKFADAVVVPTHAVAQQLSQVLDFGDRIRVIGGAVGSGLVLPDDAEERAAALGLPAEYVLSVGTLEPRKGLVSLIAAFGEASAPELPLLIVGPTGWGELDIASVADEQGLGEDRVRALGVLSDTDLALVLSRATLFVYPSIAEGFGLPVLEAMHFGVPVVHSDDPALLEVAADAGVAVERGDAKHYPERLALAMSSVLSDTGLRERLSVAGRDRSRAFSWRDSAERVWALHADL
ncbi:glycosyltransferase family 1 protein [Rathayibacter festucae]|uniref:glycosyltransferase family 4 protein n=1 Tax=Rathayibacter TaxID=33886 RepID=UPI002A6B8339|nr:glycosyltransferase family 1 protein [Rathayibacter festucae]MDY0911433.1 glycosyltransferase family 1 protein [Rathayibacter festucae]